MNIAYIPVRGGSKSIPMKNIKPIAGKPLVYWAVKASCDCKYIDKVYVSTDSDIIASVVAQFGLSKVEVVSRNEKFATDTATTESAMLDFAINNSFENIALVQATSPLIKSKDLQQGFELINSDKADSVLSVVKQKRFIWDISEDGYAESLNYDYRNRPLRQEFDGFLVENGAFYITSRNKLLNSKNRISGRIKTIIMPQESYYEIDESGDWIIVENLLYQQNSKDCSMKIKMLFCDCDGTLTDGGMYYTDSGEAMKKFNTRDAFGLRLLREKGIKIAIVTSENSEIARKRALKMGVDEISLGVTDKLTVLQDLCNKHSISLKDVAYIGDDLNDFNAMNVCGFRACPADAVSGISRICNYVSEYRGGHGAVRDVCEHILKGMELSLS